jgi:hypothetical protein
MLECMRITDNAISEFIEICREEFGKEISRRDASEMVFELVTLYEALAQRLPSDADPALSDEIPRQPIGFRVSH